MAQLRSPRSPRRLPELRYVRAPEPLVFPESALMPESKTHLVLRTFLFRLLRFALGPEHRVGSEQFLYWNAANPERCLAPDAVVRMNVPDAQFKTWKNDKLADYRELGVKELVRFDPAAVEGKRLRVWDRVEEDLVERVIADDRTPCLTLDRNWVVMRVENEPVGLRLVDDEGRLVYVQEEAAEARIRELEEELRKARGA